MQHPDYDYIVIGGGSAGCALAARLSERPDRRVLLLEAGGHAHPWDVRLRMPAAMGLAGRSRALNWGYATAAQASLGGRAVRWPRGRVLGGSSAINAMVFVRGNAADFDGWAADPALADWRYAAVLPYFKRLETYARGANLWRGDAGPVHVGRGNAANPLYDIFLEAALDAGHTFNDDVNAARQDGFGRMDMTVRHGYRVTSADAYLGAARGRANLHVVTGAQVARLVLEGRRCRGAVFTRAGRTCEVRAAREVILAAGAIGSPQILMLSGIGDAAELATVGIPARHHLPGVGLNLHDHPQLYVPYACNEPVTLQPVTSRLRQALIGGRWLLSRTGWGATNHLEVGGFARSRDGLAAPDLQFLFLPRAMHARSDGGVEVHGFQADLAYMRPRSRGRLRLHSDRHTDHPLIDPAYLAEPEDWAAMRAGIRLTREIVRQEPFDRYRGAALGLDDAATSDAALDAFIRRAAGTGYHPCGTCKMGSGPDAVVDGELRVHGLEGLRVADASIMPTITTGNLNAPSMMIGEKTADLVLGRRLAPVLPAAAEAVVPRAATAASARVA